MKRLRMAVVGLFILSLAAFIGYNIYSRLIRDNVPPTITAESDTVSVSVEAEDQSELYKGLKAEDNRDGDLTDKIRVSSMTNFTEPGKREITYAVFDSSNNGATLTRTLEYTDYTSPQIQLSEPLRYTLEEMTDVNLTANMRVEDCLDGGEASASILDTLTVKAAGTDSILLNRVLGKSEIELPVSYSAPVDTLIFEFTNVEQMLRRDTVWVMKENFPHYESPECPAAMFHVVTGVRSTHLLIDTVQVVNPNINYNASENFKIYFYTAD